METMRQGLAERLNNVPRSFIREILKVTEQPEIISFAGGLPNPRLFPIEPLKQATLKVFAENPNQALQYSSTEGYLPLRQWIANRYRKKQGLTIDVKNILITTGSQQALDLLGKVLINPGDGCIIEEPGYLGAIQAFSLYGPNFISVPLNQNGMDLDILKSRIQEWKLGKNNSETAHLKLAYTVPNFQNPSGITYTNQVRELVAQQLRQTSTWIIEDNPYGDLRFLGKPCDSFYNMLPEQTILLGSFSKTVVPSFRIGWIVAPDFVMEKLVTAKQATDLHTNSFNQQILFNFLNDGDLDSHILRITNAYGKNRQIMLDAIAEFFPSTVEVTKPEGGMFLWAELPAPLTALDLFDKAIEQKVAFVPGDPFYLDGRKASTLRLNYSCVDESRIRQGIEILGGLIRTA